MSKAPYRKRRPTKKVVWARRGIVIFSSLWLVLFVFYIARPHSEPPRAPAVKTNAIPVSQAPKKPTAYIETTVTTPPEVKPYAPQVKQQNKTASVAIIIDDIGNQWQRAQRLLQLSEPITLAILPYSPYGQKIAQIASKHNKEVILHAPMEPLHADSWEGGLSLSMNSMELKNSLNDMLDWLPEATGVNNHMGSLFTAKKEPMTQVLSVIAERGLYFLDSRTSADSQGLSVARSLAIPSAQRHVFLDNERDVELIQKQLDRLFEQAKTRGYAVGIGHPYTETLEVLERTLSKEAMKKSDVRFVKLADILTIHEY